MDNQPQQSKTLRRISYGFVDGHHGAYVTTPKGTPPANKKFGELPAITDSWHLDLFLEDTPIRVTATSSGKVESARVAVRCEEGALDLFLNRKQIEHLRDVLNAILAPSS